MLGQHQHMTIAKSRVHTFKGAIAARRTNEVLGVLLYIAFNSKIITGYAVSTVFLNVVVELIRRDFHQQ
jgi:hypothetical protein